MRTEEKYGQRSNGKGPWRSNGQYDRRRQREGDRDRSTGDQRNVESFRSSGHGRHPSRDLSHKDHVRNHSQGRDDRSSSRNSINGRDRLPGPRPHYNNNHRKSPGPARPPPPRSSNNRSPAARESLDRRGSPKQTTTPPKRGNHRPSPHKENHNQAQRRQTSPRSRDNRSDKTRRSEGRMSPPNKRKSPAPSSSSTSIRNSSSSVAATTKSLSSTPRESRSRERQQHHSHRSNSHTNRHHPAKPSALENRDNKNRDHNSRLRNHEGSTNSRTRFHSPQPSPSHRPQQPRGSPHKPKTIPNSANTTTTKTAAKNITNRYHHRINGITKSYRNVGAQARKTSPLKSYGDNHNASSQLSSLNRAKQLTSRSKTLVSTASSSARGRTSSTGQTDRRPLNVGSSNSVRTRPTALLKGGGGRCRPPVKPTLPTSLLKRRRKVQPSCSPLSKDSPLKKRRVSSDDVKSKYSGGGVGCGNAMAAKVTLDELTNTGMTNADDYEELTQVEKWVRSAPDELYYTREVNGHATATERTQTLCEKFDETLLKKSRLAREEAERQGEVRMSELIKLENVAFEEQRQARKLKKNQKHKGKCCHHNSGDSSSRKATSGSGNQTKESSSPTSAAPSPTTADVVPPQNNDQNSPDTEQKKPDEVLGNEGNKDDHFSGKDALEPADLKEGPAEAVPFQSDDHQDLELEAISPEPGIDFSCENPLKSDDETTTKNSQVSADQAEDSVEEGELVDSMDEREEEISKSKQTEQEAKSMQHEQRDERSASRSSLSTSTSAKETLPRKTGPPSESSSSVKTSGSGTRKSSVSKDDVQTKRKVFKKKKSKSEQRTKDSSTDSDSQTKDNSAANSANEDNSMSSSSDSSSPSSDDDDEFNMTRSDTANRELERRKKHPRRLHAELWHNDPGLMNDGPVCRCSAKARRFGIRHGFYPGEKGVTSCNPFTNNKGSLYHYRITISPPKNFLISTPTVINHDGHEYIFEGFSIFSHYKLDLSLPPCKVIRFNIRYDVFVEEERFPESFCVQELMLFETYLFREILELVDLKYEWGEDSSCPQFHLMPRFVRQLPDNGQEILAMSRVLIHLLKSDRELVREEDLHKLYTVEQTDWQNFADRHKGTIVTKWGMKPCAIRVDQIDRDVSSQELAEDDGIPFPLIVHFGIRPPQLSYAGNAGYQRAWRRYVKYRHLLSNMPKPSQEDKLKLLKKEMKLQTMRTASNMKRDVTVAISSRGFRTTGICCDLVQHAMLIPVLVAHLRFHKCLETLESCMVYAFNNRYLLQLAMTHPSYRENFGTNPDHARNALTNCGIRQPEYGDRRIHYASTRKRGINTLINIMAKFGADQETESDITHNERLEFLGDAVVEFVTSIHLFHIFPDLEEGGLATYRAAIVQNQHLAVLAQALNLDQYMLYAHGSDLCHDSELRHAMANCFEALMGALFLDGGIETADRVFGNTLYGTDEKLLDMWANYPKHPLQQEEPEGDRHWISSHDVLQKLAEFETSIGISFTHIRLLARAFTDRSLGYNNLTRGSNQRLEFLGDTVLQLISSEYLYRHFPDHHEGHLSLLRSSLVNNRTQSLVCDDLGMPLYAMRGDPKSEMKTKDRADLLEAFLGCLYIDKGLRHCHLFCQVCFFPRLSNSITKQEWNDPKSKLQQCCLTLRAMDGREPDIPVYKVTESLGPTNTRTYIVAVYFRGNRLATAQGHSIQEAEMNAAAMALEMSGHLFPQLHHQKRIMDKTKKFH